MKNVQNFSPLTSDQLMEVNGGGFAYDLGRIIRFIGLSGGGSPIGVTNAILDWQINALINEAENG
ncbi:MAG: hypothetical protein ABFS28_06740 [Bacteroidota bacterium]